MVSASANKTTTLRSNPFPTPIGPHELNCALLLAENARLMLDEAARLLRGDAVLALRVETAGMAVKSLQDSTLVRFQYKLDCLE